MSDLCVHSWKHPILAVLLDGGISLAPYRFSLPPHPIEFQTIARLRKTIAEAADKADVTTISHYHFDHHTPSFEDWVVNWTEDGETARQIYQNKTVFVKNPKEKINASQRQRAWMFQKTAGKQAKTVESADGKTFNYGKTVLRFSEAVAHGSEDSMLGWVIMVIVEHGDETVYFCSRHSRSNVYSYVGVDFGCKALYDYVGWSSPCILEGSELKWHSWSRV